MNSSRGTAHDARAHLYQCGCASLAVRSQLLTLQQGKHLKEKLHAKEEPLHMLLTRVLPRGRRVEDQTR